VVALYVTSNLGYVEAALELARQVEQLQIPAEKTVVVTAAGTGGTLAGLLAGFKLLDSPIRVLGLDIGKLWKGFPASIARLANGASVRLGGRVEWRPEEIPLVEGVYAGPGYAKFTPAAKEAMQLMARQEGILLDPVYSGKAFAGLLDLLRRGKFGHQQHVIFLHTGGFPALWCFGDALL